MPSYVKRKNAGKRPVRVRYYIDAKAMPDFWDAAGACKTEKGVVRGAFVRLFMGEFEKARVYREGICVLTITRQKNGMPIASFGRHTLGTVSKDGSIRYHNVKESDHDE